MSLQDQNRDQTVKLVDPKDSQDAASHLRSSQSFGGVADALIEFTQVGGYTTFRAEHMMLEGDIVIHFFRPKGQDDDYWKDKFADGMNEVAQKHFHATYPQLVAKFTEDDGAGNSLDSWWFRARGFDHLIDFEENLVGFYDKLDTAMDPHLVRTV